MAKRATKVPDAWEDDDWEVQADKAAVAEDEDPEPQQQQPTLTKAERLAQHAESNRKLWESAEAPADTFNYLASRSDPPLATGFKPAVKVLSRKPLLDNADADEEDDKKAPQLTPEEMQAKQQRERDEKQRRYDEARAKIFGSNQSSGTSTPGAVTPPRSADGRGPRGRGRGGRGGRGEHRRNDSRGDRDRERDNNQRPVSQSGGGRELYDPNYSAKPGLQPERRGNNYNNDGGAPLSRRSTPQEEQAIRAPRGPDGSGRGGFGFAKRGAKGS
ncbi:hypothetical protein F4781DRAFT_29663 [Annulohypoxylon bovei var. microspora]|nr:hypothetical protein F4781DRAFT_29663 [Annulohypoxylon bovei var. microspora]